MRKKIVLRSINNNNESLCVDIFKREDNSFGFEEYRRDLESNAGWYKIGIFGEKTFNSEDEAYKIACKNVAWLDKDN